MPIDYVDIGDPIKSTQSEHGHPDQEGHEEPLPNIQATAGNPEEVLVLLRSQTNGLGGYDIVVPWLPKSLFLPGQRETQKEARKDVERDAWSRCLFILGKRALRILSSAMVAHYYLQRIPELSSASVGTQVQWLLFPVSVAYVTGVYLAPFGLVMYGLSALHLIG